MAKRKPRSSPPASAREIVIGDGHGELLRCTVPADNEGLEGIDLTGRELSYAQLAGMVLREASLYWAILFAADLRGADLRGADLRGADLKQADLRGADLRHADLGLNRLGSATELQGANLADIRWEGAIWTGAQFDAATMFPPRFDPAAAGMVRVGG